MFLSTCGVSCTDLPRVKRTDVMGFHAVRIRLRATPSLGVLNRAVHGHEQCGQQHQAEQRRAERHAECEHRAPTEHGEEQALVRVRATML